MGRWVGLGGSSIPTPAHRSNIRCFSLGLEPMQHIIVMCGRFPSGRMGRRGWVGVSKGSTFPGTAHIQTQAFLRYLFLQAIALAEGSPLLLSYQSDCTPATTRQYVTVQPGGRNPARRVGGRGREFILEKAFLLYYGPDGVARGRILLRGAREMRGKGAWNAYSACCSFFPLARQHGRRTISTTHYIFDQGSWFKPMSRLVRARPKLYIDRNISDPDEKWLQHQMDWVVVNACGMHIAGNGAWWGTAHLLDDSEKQCKAAFA